MTKLEYICSVPAESINQANFIIYFIKTLNLVVLPRICCELENVRHWYKKQTEGQQIEFCGCVIAGIHGSFAAASSIIAILFDKNLSYTDINGNGFFKNVTFKVHTTFIMK